MHNVRLPWQHTARMQATENGVCPLDKAGVIQSDSILTTVCNHQMHPVQIYKQLH